MIMDILPADSGNMMTTDEWQRDYFPRFEGKARMAGMHDLLEAGISGTQELIDSLRWDLFVNCILTSTRDQYNCKDEEYLTHGYGGKKALKLYGSIPNYFDGMTLSKAAKMPETQEHMQKLFLTTYDISTIISGIERLSGYKAEDTVIWTPDPHNRQNGNFDRVCGMQEFFNKFVIMETVQVAHKGRTRIVYE